MTLEDDKLINTKSNQTEFLEESPGCKSSKRLIGAIVISTLIVLSCICCIWFLWHGEFERTLKVLDILKDTGVILLCAGSATKIADSLSNYFINKKLQD